MTRLLHVTSPRTALKTIRSGKFRAGPILGDAGLNCYIDPHPNGNYGYNHYAQNGAVLEFDWVGPVSSAPYTLHPPMDVPIDQHPHRAFLMVGTGQGITGAPNCLRLVSVRLMPGRTWAEAEDEPTLDVFNPATWGPWLSKVKGEWKQKKHAQVQMEVAQRLVFPVSVEIVLPRSSSYHHLLLKAFPNLR